MEKVWDVLRASGYPFLLQTYSALDRYYHVRNGHAWYIITAAPLAAFAALFDEVRYEGPADSSVTVKTDGGQAYFQCVDSLDELPLRPFTIQHFYFDVVGGRYIDALGMYPDLRARTLRSVTHDITAPLSVGEAAVLVSRYHLACPDGLVGEVPDRPVLSVPEQRWLLSSLLSGDHPDKGLALLHRAGFIRTHWPEIESLTGVAQTKDYHPEGNVFDHVLTAFTYRKLAHPALSLAILLHDLGKTVAEATRENPFKDHADRGALLARDFLRRLEFPAGLIEDTLFLIRHHMMPEALPRMPLYRVSKLLASPLFPLLLELFRADLLSTFRGPEKYYEACRIYRAYLKKTGNPFKTMRLDKPIS